MIRRTVGVFSIFTMVACSASNSDVSGDYDVADGAAEPAFRLVGDGPSDTNGPTLRLVEGGRSGAAVTYPNPRHLGEMRVRVFASGAVVSSCKTSDGAAVDCQGDTPFFTTASAAADGAATVRVQDIYGGDVASARFAPVSSQHPSLDVRTYETPTTGGEADDAEQGAAPEAAPTDVQDDDDRDCACTAPAPTGEACDEDDVIAHRDAFCADVNAWLTGRGFEAIDCAILDTEGAFEGKPVPPVKGDLGACGPIWKPSFKAVSAWLKGCHDSKSRATHWHEVVRWNLIHTGACSHSPLVIDLDGDGVHLSSLESGVHFDLLGTGPVQCAWVQGDDALVALDRNGNGKIDGAAELFGNSTAGRSWPDGFAALAELDANGDGRIDGHDPVYGDLVVWRDRDHDGASSASELSSLREVGVRALYLGAARISPKLSTDANGNEIPLVAGFERTNGTTGALVDAYLRFRP